MPLVGGDRPIEVFYQIHIAERPLKVGCRNPDLDSVHSQRSNPQTGRIEGPLQQVDKEILKEMVNSSLTATLSYVHSAVEWMV